MPPKTKFTRDKIINAAVEITRRSGISAVTARAVAAQLGASPKVIFGLFKNMEELLEEVIQSAHSTYLSYLKDDGQYPAYKSSGMGYIRFAQEEKELFKLLFMRDRSGEAIGENREEIAPILAVLRKNTGLSEEEAYFFHLEMWIYTHGIATMLATNYLPWETATISRMLTDAYEGLKARYLGGNRHDSYSNNPPDQTI